ncbi:hypothetical protein Q1695_002843 [Nippostrongylus brasiliensis]|nr:hypothetical protein Q1695_002843 [Nippostrongylus brasiliensis]
MGGITRKCTSDKTPSLNSPFVECLLSSFRARNKYGFATDGGLKAKDRKARRRVPEEDGGRVAEAIANSKMEFRRQFGPSLTVYVSSQCTH